MEIKDLATKVELGTEMADVRGGNYGIGNISFDDIASVNESWVELGDVNANTVVSGNNGTHSPIQAATMLDYRPSVSTTQTSSNNFAVAQEFKDLAISFPFFN